MNFNPRTDSMVRIAGLLGRPRPDRRQWIIRPDDLLVFDVELQNLQLEPGARGEPTRLVKSGPGEALLIVIFPPQHVAEIAYFTNTGPEGFELAKVGDPDQNTGTEARDDPPIWSVIAGWSRLVFVVPDDRLPIRWSVSDILQSMRTLDLRVPANALPPADEPSRLRDSVREIVKIASAELAEPASLAPSAAQTGVSVASAPALFTGSSGLIATVRARRMLRVNARAYGISDASGSDTVNLPNVLTASLKARDLTTLLRKPAPRPPTSAETSLEVPFELFLSPNRYAAWAHATAPVRSVASGHTELWHTRLATRGPGTATIEGPHPLRRIRATWTTAGELLTSPPFGANVDTPGAGGSPRMSMDAFDKHNVVHLSSNFQLKKPKSRDSYFEPRAIDVNHFALSSLGAWMDTRGVWDELPGGLSVEEWRHRATMARDHYVRIVYRGFLFPWGHRASLVKITERCFDGTKAGNPAYLFQRMFIIVREPVREYRNSHLVYEGPDSATRKQGEQFDLMMPFVSVRVTTLVSPLLDPPEDSIDGNQESCFWPYVGGQPFKFNLVGIDIEGNPVELAMPLVFVRKEHLDHAFAGSVIPHVAEQYETANWPGETAKRSTVPVSGQRVAFAASAAPDDTTFAVESLTFGGEVPQEATYNRLDPLEPRFFPVVRGSAINVPSLQAIAGSNASAAMVYSSAYLVNEFSATNSGQVFLGADPSEPQFAVGFSKQSQRSGGFLSPDMALSGMSRIGGPVSGDLNLATQGSFDPNSWFGPIADALLFGILKLKDILDVAGFDELDKLPRFTGQLLNPVEKLIADLDSLGQRISGDAAAIGNTVLAQIDQLTNPATGSISALLKGGSVDVVLGQLSALDSSLATFPDALAGSTGIAAGPKAALNQSVATLRSTIAATISARGTLQQFAAGGDLPKAISARFEWRPRLKRVGPFQPSGDRNLLLAVQAAGESFNVTCSLDEFTIDLEVVLLEFERVQFRVLAGKKPEVDVKLRQFKFAGPLSFVETLRELIPLDGFSDPPSVEVTSEGITAGYSVGLPNIAVGVFSLENLAISAGFAVPFVGKPMSTWFRFCERENPARLTVALFGGGFFLGLTMNADGLQALEGAIEFGAAVSVDLGVAAGGVSVMAGLYFKIESDNTTLAGYFRMRGMVRALGIVTVSLELYLEMRYETASGKCVGTATITIEVDIAMFSVSVSVSCTKKFAGSNADPTLAELLDVAPNATSADWNSYCEAFA